MAAVSFVLQFVAEKPKPLSLALGGDLLKILGAFGLIGNTYYDVCTGCGEEGVPKKQTKETQSADFCMREGKFCGRHASTVSPLALNSGIQLL